MLILSSIIICLSLLGLAVLMLHSYQLRAAAVSAERSVPLMAKAKDSDLQLLEINQADWQFTSNDIDTDSLSNDDNDAVLTLSDSLSKDDKNPLADFKTLTNNWSSCSSSSVEKPKTETKKTLQEPLHYPLLGAYNQRCMQLRRELKGFKAGSKQLANTLLILYRTAALAELLHSKKSEGKLSLGQLKRLPEELLEKLDMPYAQLGYSHLSLLRKSDIKRMQLVWGKPALHQCPRNYHRQSWQNICNNFG